jgi:hypothetical protein
MIVQHFATAPESLAKTRREFKEGMIKINGENSTAQHETL